MKELIATIKSMADDARRAFASSEQWTVADEEFGAVSCATIRVPVAMLNRIDKLAAALAADPHIADAEFIRRITQSLDEPRPIVLNDARERATALMDIDWHLPTIGVDAE